MTLQSLLVLLAGFAVVAVASSNIGRWFTKIKLPLITGFLFTGIMVGPFALNLVPAEAIEPLRFVDELALAFIAFAAGSELYIRELRNRMRSIVWVTAGLVVATFTLGVVAVLLLAEFIPFMQPMPLPSRVAVAVLIGAILVARSPSAAIAIINELRARGPFTQTVLGVTVIMDVVVIVLFAINSSAAAALLTGLSFNLGFVGVLVFDLTMALVFGYVLSKLLEIVMARRWPRLLKITLILATGYGVFVLAEELRHFSHDNIPFDVLIEPLLVCMIGSFLLANRSRHRGEFLQILHENGLPIYVLFFTLVGASLQLDVLARTWPIAVALFIVRLAGIFIGSFAGGVIAGEPMAHNRIRWLAFVTQAGVALGLAKEVAVEFSEFGSAFATLIISLVVLNEVIGPICFKWTINHVGESHTRAATPEFDGRRDALIFGLEGQSLALARQLYAHKWQVKIAARQTDFLEDSVDETIQICPINGLSFETLEDLEARHAEAIITMLSDEENFQICELAFEHYGTDTLIVRLNDRANFDRFHELGALIVDPATAIVSLYDHLVRSPSAASLLLGTDVDQDIVDIEVRNPNLHGLALRSLRLPEDALILSVYREGRMLISHGYTRLKIGDRVTVVGSATSLEALRLRFSA